MSGSEERALIEAAREVRERAHAPYSKFKVGAALFSRNGRIFTGCNVENASYGLTLCAERAALVSAVSGGEREFEALAICAPGAPAPCGACRQVLNEFGPELMILMVNSSNHETARTHLSTLLPEAFQQDSLDICPGL
ncbi:MAG: cytidine deaminase [Verrucomicrobiaceae bacterium]|nr:cytidine deaminase [Verrucomicrobiaceae bacterium]